MWMCGLVGWLLGWLVGCNNHSEKRVFVSRPSVCLVSGGIRVNLSYFRVGLCPMLLQTAAIHSPSPPPSPSCRAAAEAEAGAGEGEEAAPAPAAEA